ncbi:MAG: hypothetical protein OHK0022_17010 [Roseiflexaceae bacterium]
MTPFPQSLFRRRALALPCTLLLAAALLLMWLPLERPAPTRAAPADLLNETFTGATLNTSWTLGSDGQPGVDPACLTAAAAPPAGNGCTFGPADTAPNGALRLTNNKNNQAGFALSNTIIPAGNGLSVTFDYYAYNGSNGGADGITFFLIDGTVTPTQAGAFGGSLGYAQKTGVPGIAGGYVGIGIDEYGNFSNAAEGRGTGCTTSYNSPGSAGLQATGLSPDRITVRGARNPSDASGLTGYCYLESGLVSGSLDNPSATTRSTATKRTINLTLSPQNILSVRVDGAVVVSGLSLQIPGQPPFPASFKVGFAGATGGSTNYHEIQNLVVRALGPDLRLIKSHTGNFTVGQNASYTLQVSTTGAGGPLVASDNITVTDTLPPQLTYVSATGTNWSCGALSQQVICYYTGAPVGTGINLPPINLTVLPTASGAITNTATVSTQREIDPSNNTSNDPTTINAFADLSVVKLRTSTPAPGQPITYNITVRNNGPSSVTGAVVQDNVPAAITAVSWSCAPLMYCGASGGTGNTINFPVSLPSGQSVTITVNGTISSSATGMLANAATVTAPAGTTDPNLGNNTSTDSFIIAPTAVTLTSFSARRAGGQVQVAWATSAEQNTLGFRLYRSSTGQRADAQQITAQLIPATGQGGAGASYTWNDSTAQAGVSYSYWLAEVSLAETTTEYGPALLLSARLYIPIVAR